MPRRRRLQISLANKCRALFGLAVLLILTAALAVPWIRLDDLYQELNRQDLELVADRAAAQRAASPDPKNWKPNEPGVEFIDLGNLTEAGVRLYRDNFLRRSVEQMRGPARWDDAFAVENPNDSEPICRFVRAVRDVKPDRGTGRLVGVITVTAPLKNFEIQIWNRAVILAAGALAGVLALLVFYFITQGLILSPVRQLRRTAEQVKEGDLSVRASINTHDEFEDLSDAFNDMLENINRSHDELQKINRSLDVKLGELAETNVALYEANRLKSTFLANVSHELRTPMTSIIGFAELLRDAGEDQDGRIRRYASNILTSGRMLLELINDLLDLAKIEAGRTDVHRTEFHLQDVCDGLVDFFQPLADKKRITLSVINEGEWPVMKSDAGKIKQILYNLLSNAIKFTPEEGRVELSVRPDEDSRIEMRVRDTGPGIPDDQRDSIFEPFRQLDGSVTREHGGTGLGLTISRELARTLGGSLRLAERTSPVSTPSSLAPDSRPPAPDTAPLSDATDFHGASQADPPFATGAEFVVDLPLTSPDAVLNTPVRLN